MVLAHMPIARASQIGDIIKNSVGLLQQLLLAVFGIAVVVFAWGIVKLIVAAGSPEKIKQARAIIWYGIIGMFVFVSIWGIITVLQQDIGIEPGAPVPPPQFTPR
jgi:hypothetical protein